MARRPGISPEDRATAISLLEQGESCGAIAKVIGRDPRLVADIAHQEGIDTVTSARERAVRARIDFNTARRLELGNKIAARLAELVDSGYPLIPKDLRDVAVTFGVLTDKRRLEDGESTANVNQHTTVWRRRAGTPKWSQPPQLGAGRTG